MSLSCLMPLKKRPLYVFSAHDGSDHGGLWNYGMCVVVISASQLCSSVSWLQMALISETSEQCGDNGDKLRRPECDNENNVSDAAEMTPLTPPTITWPGPLLCGDCADHLRPILIFRYLPSNTISRYLYILFWNPRLGWVSRVWSMSMFILSASAKTNWGKGNHHQSVRIETGPQPQHTDRPQTRY